MAFIQNHCYFNRSLYSGKGFEFVGVGKSCIKCPVRCKEGYSSDYEKDLRNGKRRKLRILIAGGGVGGLVLALAAKNRGFEVKVFEKNLSAVRGEGQHRGPIQLQSNALSVLEAIDQNVAQEIMNAGCITGDRINGLADGLSGNWFVKFDLRTPAVKMGLPVTLVVCRMKLQRILLNALGFHEVHNNSNVVDFKEGSEEVSVILEDGRQYEGDVLVGADGIWSKVRTRLFGCKEARYGNYTCYTGLTDFVPPYTATVGYRVFLGLSRYFVASDVGAGKMQWYAFHREPPGNTDPPAGRKKRLFEIFKGWCPEVVDLISETSESMILRRDIYDRDMIYTWGRGCVTLLGDAAHAMLPNLGQGGCMAIEDGYHLILELEKAVETNINAKFSDEIALALKRYERRRMIRVAVVHAVSRITSKMLTTYQPYLDFGSGYLYFLTRLRLPHPGYLVARLFLRLGMQWFMVWLLVGHV